MELLAEAFYGGREILAQFQMYIDGSFLGLPWRLFCFAVLVEQLKSLGKLLDHGSEVQEGILRL